ncbi:hypothetical protein B566_EDAN003857 [Ephemera danica]|nr:hypothetical protein B566_EDAN003857 [Ephemera danica]
MGKLLKAIAVGDIRLACYYIGIEGSEILAPAMPRPKQTCHPLCMCEECLHQPEDRDSNFEYLALPNDEPLMANSCNAEGITALHAAAMYGRPDLVPLLICAGASINVRTTSRAATPLHLACQNKRTTTVSALLDVPGCDINAQDSRSNTPIHYACLSGSAPLVQLLLNFAPNLNLRNIEGRTPLEEAEEKMALRMVQLLRGNLLMNE